MKHAKPIECALAVAVVGLAVVLVLRNASAIHIVATLTPPAIASAAYSYARAQARSATALAEMIALRWRGGFHPAGLAFYKSGTRISAGTGETVHIFEFKQANPLTTVSAAACTTGDFAMQQQLVTFVVGAILKELQKLMPDLPPDADAQVTLMVTGGVGLLWDIAKLEGTKELQKLGAGELAKLFPQLASK